jgi:hypothetical protein
MRNVRLNPSFLTVFLLALAFGTIASAQASRTWISGVGDDANPCSRTAPCKTFAGAISKTAAGGEIDALDPGGFGAVTITKSITLDGGSGIVASILASGSNGIVISAAATDTVTIRNLDINGLVAAYPTLGLDGIKILSAGNVHIEHCQIFGFSQNGVEVAAGASVNVSIDDTRITDPGLAAVIVATSGGTASVDITNLHAYEVHPAVTGGANSTITISNSDLAVGPKGIKQVSATSFINVIGCNLTGFTIDALESITGATIRASGNTLAENTLAVNPNGGTISSDGTNTPLGNGNNGTFNGTPISKY